MIALVLAGLLAAAPTARDLPAVVSTPQQDERREARKAFARECERHGGLAIFTFDAEEGMALVCVRPGWLFPKFPLEP